jgi:hypothetical protein
MWIMFQGDVNRTLEGDIKGVKDELVKSGVFARYNERNHRAVTSAFKEPELEPSPEISSVQHRCPKCKHQFRVATIKMNKPILKDIAEHGPKSGEASKNLSKPEGDEPRG